ncbi:hypothetical protein WI40_07630 [Burkholderia ubonensis]|uniref:efflux RND transporter permease subunit n=1 Tax=Burkholderia ubonensis TaxID=101571 RepID=UPI00075EDB78|nr:efflux RND transporter permease subunit [Burkholderia ubonensis]KVA01652.1 hypothetical protein WI40_07630 [Burkholderia ubonensis]
MRLLGTFNGWRTRTPKLTPPRDTGALTVPDLLDARANARADHAPLRLPSGARLTYGAWRARSGSAALGLYQNGLRIGARVALVFDGLDWLDYAVAYMAVLRCGATAIHMNGHMPDAEIQRRLAECECSTLIRSRFVAPPRGFSGQHFTIDELLRGDESLSAIPILPTFAAMSWLGFSLNTLTLLALAVVIGILVDDAIVEVENIEAHRRSGKSIRRSVEDAIHEIALPVVATTMALVAVFLPTATMAGITGRYFVQFGWTSVIAVHQR